jgi:glycosyltransferase involved in cell wall biosynthesis
MSAGCIPVVTRAGSRPEVVGDAGAYADSTDPQALAAAVRRGLGLGEETRRRARARVVEQFPLERRRQALTALVEGLAA